MSHNTGLVAIAVTPDAEVSFSIISDFLLLAACEYVAKFRDQSGSCYTFLNLRIIMPMGDGPGSVRPKSV